MNVRRQFAPAPRLFGGLALLAIAAAAPALFGGGGAIYGALMTLAAVAAAYDALAGFRERITASSARLPTELFVGGDAEAVVLLARRGAARPAPCEVLLETDARFAPSPPMRLALASEGETEVRLPLRPRRRGDAAAAVTLWVRRESPARLWRFVDRFALGAAPSVEQDVRPVREAARRADLRAADRPGLRTRLTPGEGSDFDALREFAPGHDRRAMHWKASARHRRLLVRDFRAEASRQIVIAFDTGRLVSEPLGGVARLDHAVRAALLLAFDATTCGDRLGGFSFGGAPGEWTPPAAGKSAFRAFRSFTATLVARAEETNFTAGLVALGSKLRRRSLVVVMTEFADPTSAELMTDHLGVLAKRHQVVFLAFRDPALERVANEPPRRLVEAAAAAVAYDLVRDRAQVLSKLRRLGVEVLDVAADAAPTALVERYLALKRRERL
jgi:uncharacterized protein (DUF58 family)